MVATNGSRFSVYSKEEWDRYMALPARDDGLATFTPDLPIEWYVEARRTG